MTEASIIGTGTMGCGIAQALLSSGNHVILIGRSGESAAAGLRRLAGGFDKAVSKGSITKEQKGALLNNVKLSWDMKDVANSIIIIEAVPEVLQTKQEVLRNIEENALENAMIATNTSSISVTALAAALKNRSRFIGLHFFNPVPVMKIVEIVNGTDTSSETTGAARKFVESLGKTGIEVRDSPGFVSNRILMIYLNEAIKALQEGIASKEGIDTIAKLGFNHPMGPLELSDFIGLDVCLDIMNEIYRQSNDAKFRPARMLVDLVGMGRLGRKSGAGFYDYRK